MPATDALLKLQDWYRSQCDGDWEHAYGVKIETLDNPGWSLEIDLKGTELEHAHFEKVILGEVAHDRAQNPNWLVCEVKDNVFHGAGGPGMLGEMVTTFMVWASGAT